MSRLFVAIRASRRLDWQSPSSFFLSDPEWKRKLFIGGLWILACPPLGWPMALGYQKALIGTLLAGSTPVLPEWRGRQLEYLAEGFRAIGVMLVYFTPFFVLLWRLAVPDIGTLQTHLPQVALFFVGVLLFVPICLPILPFLYVRLFDWFSLTRGQALALAALFVLTTFVIPAVYMQVSRTGRFLSAFNPVTIVRLLRHNLRLYIEAWLQSLALSAVGLSLCVLAPWGIFWSYLGIVYCFNEIYARSPIAGFREVARNARLFHLGMARTSPPPRRGGPGALELSGSRSRLSSVVDRHGGWLGWSATLLPLV